MSQLFRTPWTVAPTVTVIAILAACGKTQQSAAPPAPDKTVPAPIATVNGAPLSRAEFDIYTKMALQGKQQELNQDQKNQVLDALINTDILASQAVKDGADKAPDVDAQLEVMRLKILADADIQKYLKSHEPTDAELHAEFDREAAATDMTQYEVRHILLAAKDKDLAVQLIKKLKHGAKFEDVAKASSIDPGSSAKGGELGWFDTAHLPKPLGDAIKGLKKGEITPEPVQTQFGWHILELEDTRPAAFDQANKVMLSNAIMQKKVKDYIDTLRKDAKIDKHM